MAALRRDFGPAAALIAEGGLNRGSGAAYVGCGFAPRLSVIFIAPSVTSRRATTSGSTTMAAWSSITTGGRLGAELAATGGASRRGALRLQIPQAPPTQVFGPAISAA